MENLLLTTINEIFKKNNISNIETIHKNNIIRNLRNEEYITRLLLKFHEDIPYTKIYDFVKRNQKLHNLINEYEQEVILTYLQQFVINIEAEEYELIELEEIFRRSVINNLTALGINKIAIEECLEINNHLWFEQCVNKSFESKFIYDEQSKEYYYHKLYFTKMRRYIYYQRHKYIVDLYGTITPEMLMTEDEAKELGMKIIESNQKYNQLTLKK